MKTLRLSLLVITTAVLGACTTVKDAAGNTTTTPPTPAQVADYAAAAQTVAGAALTDAKAIKALKQ